MSVIEWFNPEKGVPIISIAWYGLNFNNAAIEEIGKPPRVRLGFDHERYAVVVQPLRDGNLEDSKQGFIFAGKERNGYVRVSSKDFVRFVARFIPEMSMERTVRYLAKWDEDNGVLVVDLNRPADIERGASSNEDS